MADHTKSRKIRGAIDKYRHSYGIYKERAAALDKQIEVRAWTQAERREELAFDVKECWFESQVDGAVLQRLLWKFYSKVYTVRSTALEIDKVIRECQGWEGGER